MRPPERPGTAIFVPVFALPLLLAGCASHGPVLYPNTFFKAMGEEKGYEPIGRKRKKASFRYQDGSTA